MERPSFDEYIKEIVSVVSKRSTCIRRSCGAVIVKDGQILSTGYNGAPRGVSHCSEKTCIRTLERVPSGERMELCWGAHAEQNAIAQAAKHGVSVNNSTLYVSTTPCSMCVKNIINAGIIEIVIVNVGPPYSDPISHGLINQSGIKLRQI